MNESGQSKSDDGAQWSRIWLILPVFLFAVDRLHKYLQVHWAGWSGGEIIRFDPVFDYVLVWNRGVSLSMFAQLPPWVLSAGTGAIILFLSVWWWRSSTWLTKLGLGLVIAGATSNWIDRILYGAVADFFHLRWHEFSFFVFNIADVAISFGAIMFVWDMIRPASENSS